MAGAYTPGLTVSGDIVVRRIRRLPIKGEVQVSVGDHVSPTTVVARALLPGVLQTIKLADQLGVEAKDVRPFLKVKDGDAVEVGDLVAEGKKMFGLFKAPTATSEYKGTIESFSEVTGNLLVRAPSIPIEMNAYIEGTVAEILPEEGAIIETRGAMVQGIFGVGGERLGKIRVAVADHEEILDVKHILPTDAGNIIVGGAGVTAAAIKKVTEGFGFLPMAQRTFDLLKTLDGQSSSINGATQIRAGVIRPEVIVPNPGQTDSVESVSAVLELGIGASIRVIREPYFGKLASVTELPPELVTLESGTTVRVLKAKLADGEEVTVPRANVEIVAGK